MDSINQQQEEKNHEDLSAVNAGKKIKELAGKSNTCFFCTDIQSGKPLTVRPMSVQKMDEEGNFWFLSASDSYKNKELTADN
jgi:general stress protein 26